MVKKRRGVFMSEFFKNIKKVEYEGKESKNPFSFKHYNPDEVIMGKPMREHLKFALSYWHTLCGEGVDMFGNKTIDKSFGGTTPLEIYKNRALAAFELMDKLQIDYFCFHDRDIAPEGENLAETEKYLDEMSFFIENLMKKYNKKLLWGTANLFSHPRYANGAATSNSADIYAFACAQVKKAIDITIRLNGAGYVFWGGREGYETLLNTDMELELDNLARFLKMAVKYARGEGFTGDFYIEPKPYEPTKHQYDFDVATTIAFLRKYDLIDDFKINIEANHATLAGHTFAHELRVARINGVFGSIDANEGDYLLGYDTDKFPTNVYETTLCMYEVLKAGGFKNGGLNFDAKARRASNTYEDIFLSYIAGMDAFALGLKIAAKLIEDGRVDGFVKERYQSFYEGIGKEIREGKHDFYTLSAYAKSLGDIKTAPSGKQEYLENIINQIMFGGI